MHDDVGRGALLLHGFTGSPSHLDSLRDHLATRGFPVLAPLLPGHGTNARDLRLTGWRDWHRAASTALDALGPRVAIAGLSMGALLAILLAAERGPERVGALALMSTPLWLRWHLRILKRVLTPVIPYFPKGAMDVRDARHRRPTPGYRFYPVAAVGSLTELMAEARRAAPRVRSPALVVHARRDHTAPLACADMLERTLGGSVHRLTLHRSFHVVTLDVERQDVAQRVGDFFAEQMP